MPKMIPEPLKYQILQSHENLQKVLPDFQAAIDAGYDPNLVKDQIFAKYHITDSDFMDSDARKLIRQVEAMYKKKHGYGAH